MDFTNATRTAPVSAANVTPRSDVIAARDSVSVDLSPEKTVQSAQAGNAVLIEIRARTREENAQAAERRGGTNRQQDQAGAEQVENTALERRLIIEPRSGSVVLEKKDPDTGETVSQFPDETLLKLRIYSRELIDRARQAEEASPSIERSA